MSDRPESMNTRWFLDRLPSKQLAEFERNGVKPLVNIVMERAIVNGGVVPLTQPDANPQAVEAALQTALAAAVRISSQGDNAPLTPEEKTALELFVLVVSRPALLVQRNRAIGRSELWPEIGRISEAIPPIARGVGRIQDAAGAKIGTGFIAGDRRVLTNNHVVCGLLGYDHSCWQANPAGYAEKCTAAATAWQTAAPTFELKGEAGSNETSRVKLTRVVSHHRDIDVAVLELASMPEGAEILNLAKAEPPAFVGLRVFAIGYPVSDSSGSTPQPIFRRIFGTDPALLGTKRFAPGAVMRWDDDKAFLHDASTLPGSSGSCIVDFATTEVVGIHFAGSYGYANYAVPLWKYRSDPVLVNAGIKL